MDAVFSATATVATCTSDSSPSLSVYLRVCVCVCVYLSFSVALSVLLLLLLLIVLLVLVSFLLLPGHDQHGVRCSPFRVNVLGVVSLDFDSAGQTRKDTNHPLHHHTELLKRRGRRRDEIGIDQVLARSRLAFLQWFDRLGSLHG